MPTSLVMRRTPLAVSLIDMNRSTRVVLLDVDDMDSMRLFSDKIASLASALCG